MVPRAWPVALEFCTATAAQVYSTILFEIRNLILVKTNGMYFTMGIVVLVGSLGSMPMAGVNVPF